MLLGKLNFMYLPYFKCIFDIFIYFVKIVYQLQLFGNIFSDVGLKVIKIRLTITNSMWLF